MAGKPPAHPLTPRDMLTNFTKTVKPRIAAAKEEATRLKLDARELAERAAVRPAYRPMAMTAVAEANQAVGKVNTMIDAARTHQADLKAAAEAGRERLAGPGIAGVFTSRAKTNQVRLSMTGKGTRRNTTSGGDIVTHLLTIRNQVKLYHWQTKSFARHTATDALTTALDTNIDAFVESYMGRYGRPKVSGSLKLHNFSESAAKSFVATQTVYLTKVLPRKLKSTDTDLLNLRDTILGDLTKVLYLFTLQ